jgi:AcrR family transcriptional regulator
VGRPSRAEDKRRELLPTVARAFAEFGYRRVTTAELAERCQVMENVLYRLWRDKKAMFIAALDHVYERATDAWRGTVARDGPGTPAERMLAYEAKHIGEFSQMRIVFAGLSETDDPEIRQALVNMYRKYHAFVLEQIDAHRPAGKSDSLDHSLAAWAFIGLGTMATIARELELLSALTRQALMKEIGAHLLEGVGDKRH